MCDGGTVNGGTVERWNGGTKPPEGRSVPPFSEARSADAPVPPFHRSTVYSNLFRRFLRRLFPDLDACLGPADSAWMAISAVCRDTFHRIRPRFRVWISANRR
jgi:hypothetical protein